MKRKKILALALAITTAVTSLAPNTGLLSAITAQAAAGKIESIRQGTVFNDIKFADGKDVLTTTGGAITLNLTTKTETNPNIAANSISVYKNTNSFDPDSLASPVSSFSNTVTTGSGSSYSLEIKTDDEEAVDAGDYVAKIGSDCYVPFIVGNAVYTVSFDADNNTEASKVRVGVDAAGEEADVTTPSTDPKKAKYTFKGWGADKKQKDETITVTGSTTVVAAYNENVIVPTDNDGFVAAGIGAEEITKAYDRTTTWAGTKISINSADTNTPIEVSLAGAYDAAVAGETADISVSGATTTAEGFEIVSDAEGAAWTSGAVTGVITTKEITSAGFDASDLAYVKAVDGKAFDVTDISGTIYEKFGDAESAGKFITSDTVEVAPKSIQFTKNGANIDAPKTAGKYTANVTLEIKADNDGKNYTFAENEGVLRNVEVNIVEEYANITATQIQEALEADDSYLTKVYDGETTKEIKSLSVNGYDLDVTLTFDSAHVDATSASVTVDSITKNGDPATIERSVQDDIVALDLSASITEIEITESDLEGVDALVIEKVYDGDPMDGSDVEGTIQVADSKVVSGDTVTVSISSFTPLSNTGDVSSNVKGTLKLTLTNANNDYKFADGEEEIWVRGEIKKYINTDIELPEKILGTSASGAQTIDTSLFTNDADVKKINTKSAILWTVASSDNGVNKMIEDTPTLNFGSNELGFTMVATPKSGTVNFTISADTDNYSIYATAVLTVTNREIITFEVGKGQSLTYKGVTKPTVVLKSDTTDVTADYVSVDVDPDDGNYGVEYYAQDDDDTRMYVENIATWPAGTYNVYGWLNTDEAYGRYTGTLTIGKATLTAEDFNFAADQIFASGENDDAVVAAFTPNDSELNGKYSFEYSTNTNDASNAGNWATKVNAEDDYYVYVITENTDNYNAVSHPSTIELGKITVQDVVEEVTVTFKNALTGATIGTDKIVKGTKVSKPADPADELGFAFDDWYTAATAGTKIDFNNVIDSDTTMYAQYTMNPVPTVTVKTFTPGTDSATGSFTANKTGSYRWIVSDAAKSVSTYNDMKALYDSVPVSNRGTYTEANKEQAVSVSGLTSGKTYYLYVAFVSDENGMQVRYTTFKTTGSTNTNTNTSSGGSGGGSSSNVTTKTETSTDAAGNKTTTTTATNKTTGQVTETATTQNTDGSKEVVKTVTNKDGSGSITDTETSAAGAVTEAVATVGTDGAVDTITVTATNASKTSTTNTEYTATSTKAVTLKDVDTTKTSVTVPATVKVGNKSFKVTAIAKNALSGNKKITKVTIGKNVKKIGANAFKGDKKLKTVEIKGAVKTVGKNAFSGIAKKATITIKASKTNYKKAVKAIKKSGVAKTVTFKRAK